MRLRDQIAIVTGAGSGIGRASALRFAGEGARVVAVDIDAAINEETVLLISQNGGSAMSIVADVTSESDVREMIRKTVEEYGSLNILFNNAGGGTEAPVAELSEEIWTKMVDLNLKSVFLGCKHAIPEMIKAGGGVILSTSSILADVALEGLPSYSAAKAGIIALTRQIAVEYARHGIRANCLCPGWILTPTLQQALNAAPDPARARADAVEKIPLGRFGNPEEIANAALFLVSSESSFITGAAITVDGGYTIR